MFVESVIILNEAFERLLAAVGVWGASRYKVGLLWAEAGGGRGGGWRKSEG